ncbi:nitronate monooxygenase [Streptosporangiaceae bacterium NEAU-GS5]|nr:nitronate monooxygenase [Streptosporangiaceae bacterium NEAU-GS5]
MAAVPRASVAGAQRAAARDARRLPDRPPRQHQHLLHRPVGAPDLAAPRRARGSGEHRVLRHVLLDPQAHDTRVRAACGHGQRGRPRPGGGGRAVRLPPSRPAARGDEPVRARLRLHRRLDAAGLGPPRRERGRRDRQHGFPAGHPGRRAGDAHARRRRAGRARPARPGRAAAQGSGRVKTALTGLVGCRHPIVQAGMGYVATAGLAAAASAAGGLGIVGAATMSVGEMTEAIRTVRERTDAPFGVNIRSDADDAADRIDVIIKEQVRVASFARAPAKDLIKKLKDAGVVVMPSVGARRHAEKVAAWGVDALIVQGGEAGGHTGPTSTSVLLPQVVDVVDIPVVAAGGFFDGRGLVAALAYGAAGIAMGTRFLLTTDSPVPDAVKKAYLAAADTVVTTRVDGVPHRVLRTPFVDGLEHSRLRLARALLNSARFKRVSGLSWGALLREGRRMRHGGELTWAQVLQAANTPTLLKAAMVDGRADLGVMASGQVVGVLADLPSCAELIDRIMAEAEAVLAKLTAPR